jgi:hypothetical protein
LTKLATFVPIMALPLQAGEFYGAIHVALEAKGEMTGNKDSGG